ncbi:hypothetical protein [Kribbella deserti]|uniref:DUF4440 domain-containing protein n=1 Tax=Kribbella deserti TaxID=1926257 RepID=A0ABV6QLA9_9ACTN
MVAILAAGGLVWRELQEPTAQASENKPAAPGPDVQLRSAEVDRVLIRRAKAVLAKDSTAFVADIDPADKELLAEQRILFDNLVQFGFSRLSYHQKREQFDQTLIERHGPTTYAVQVVMIYQIKGINRLPVRTLVGYVFVQRPDGKWVITDDDDLDRALPRGSHHEAWDVGPVLVQRAPRVLIVVERGQTELAANLLTEASSAVRTVTKRWPGGWIGAGVVIAVDDPIVRGADYSVERNAEDALAMATWVYRTLPGEVTTEGERADSYVVVNPRNRGRLDTRSLAHEFIHVAAARYGAHAPRWLVEGVATYVEYLPMAGERDLALDAYRAMVRTKYLAKAKALPADSTFFARSSSSYPLSWLAADYLFSKHGPTEVATLYQELAALGFSQNARDRIMLEHVGVTEVGLFRALRNQPNT